MAHESIHVESIDEATACGTSQAAPSTHGSTATGRVLSLEPSVRNFLRLAVALVALCGALSVRIAGAAPEVKPAVYDTGYEIVPLITMPSIYWLDNERLLFSGMKAARRPRPDTRKVYIWDSKTNTLQSYADALAVCFSEGFISYQLHVDKAARTETVREGPFGSEKEIVRPLPPQGAIRSNLTCRTHLRSDLIPPQPLTRLVVVLRDGDGYLDLGPTSVGDRRLPLRNLVLYRPRSDGTKLPMAWDEDFSTVDIAYSAYRKAYVLRPRAPRGALNIVGQWPKGRPLRVYLLWPDGRSETTYMPYFPAEFLTNPQPTRVGWIFGGGNFYKASGLYLFDGGTVSKIDVGLVKETAVSQDGCKAAVGIQNDHLTVGTPVNLKIFNFCAVRP